MTKKRKRSEKPPDGYEEIADERIIDKHTSEIEEIRTSLNDHKERWGNPEQIALRIEEAQKDSKKLDNLLAAIFCSLLTDNHSVKEAVSTLVTSTDRNIFFSTFKRWGKVVGGALLYILGVISPLLLDWLKKKLGM